MAFTLDSQTTWTMVKPSLVQAGDIYVTGVRLFEVGPTMPCPAPDD
jgi:hypothetical protein